LHALRQAATLPLYRTSLLYVLPALKGAGFLTLAMHVRTGEQKLIALSHAKVRDSSWARQRPEDLEEIDCLVQLHEGPVRNRIVPQLRALVRDGCNPLQRFAQAFYLPGQKAEISREFG
jgi:hypothetical protein